MNNEDLTKELFAEMMAWVAAEQYGNPPLSVGHIVSVCATMAVDKYGKPWVIVSSSKDFPKIGKLVQFAKKGGWRSLGRMQADGSFKVSRKTSVRWEDVVMWKYEDELSNM